jgi:hypothetical protein
MVATDTPNPDQSINPPDFTASDLTPAAFPHPIVRLDVRETHISWVVLTGPYAYKIKKNVRFDFLDASTPERRHDLCQEELRLNRRLAGDLYVDVVSITRDAGGLRVGGQGQVLDYAVRMKQFDVALALRLADFHRQGASCRDHLCRVSDDRNALAVRRHLDARWLTGTTQVLSVIPSYMLAQFSGRLSTPGTPGQTVSGFLRLRKGGDIERFKRKVAWLHRAAAATDGDRTRIGACRDGERRRS